MSQQHSAPHTHANDDYELPIDGFKGTPEEIERQWFEKCYKGRGDSMLQLTFRAVAMGSLLGMLLSLTNIYIGLKAGWGFGVAITACILSYAIWTTLYKIGLVRTPMTILENNCMQSTASAAGYSTGGTLISAFAAWMMITNQTMPIPLMLAWVFMLAVLGVTMAIPMKRQMINIEQLRFPSGVAAAETLRALHSHGEKGMRSAKALGVAGLLAAISQFWKEGLQLIHHGLSKFSIDAYVGAANTAVLGPTWVARTVSFAWDPLFLAAGAITGPRVCISMFIGGVTCWMIFVPIMVNNGTITLSVMEAVPYLPAGFSVAEAQKIAPGIRYDDVRYSLVYEGVMTSGQRDALLATSEDLYFQSAVHRMYVRSQFQAAAPLAALPPGISLDGEIGQLVQFDPQKGLIAPELISPDKFSMLMNANGDESWRSAVQSLYERSLLESVEPLWCSAPLEKLPERFRIARDLTRRLQFDSENNLLLWRGAMRPEDREKLIALSGDEAYRAAVSALETAAANRSFSGSIPAELQSVVHWDAARLAFVAVGEISDEAAEKLGAMSDEPAVQASFAALKAASGASRAAENYRDLIQWTLWGGTACMVTSGLLAFGLQWRSALSAFKGLGTMFSTSGLRGDKQDQMVAIETPISWFVIGQVVGLIGISYLAHVTFEMPYWQSVVAVILSFALALVACRVTGETDTTPVGAMGKITQLTFGVLAPGNMQINLMSANITAAAAGSSADLLTDLKSGYLLGASPRRQFIAQFCGIFGGTIATVLAFQVIVPDASYLGTTQFPAPAAQTWKGVAEALADITKLHPVKIWSMVVGGAIGLILPLLSMALPKYKNWIPSAAGVGLAWVFHFFTGLNFLLGAILGWAIQRAWPKVSEEYTFPVASGVIAGASLMGVLIIFIENGPEIFMKFVYGH
jgi:uncharacterized oligopeptide transporter (OPT) family protein